MADVALVTGAAGALGSEVARTLGARGYRVALVDVPASQARLEELARSIAGACAIAGDITNEATWQGALDRVKKELGAAPSAAALIAGTWRGGKALHEQPNDDVWRSMLATNLETVYRSLRALLPPMVESRRGSIVVIGSRAAEVPSTSAGAAAYAASKAAVVALAKAVAAEVLEQGVRVNAVLPSALDTAANRAAMPKADPSRWVSLPSAAGVIAFLLGDDSRDVSGAAIPLYGKS